MDDELFEALYQIILKLWTAREKRVQYAGRTIVLLFLWSAIRGKPRHWVCQRRNLPRRLKDHALPGRSQFGRRLNSTAVQALLRQLENHLRGLPSDSLLGCWLLDAKPLVVSPYSKDKSARWGWAYDGKARGYKLFALTDLRGKVVAWQTRSMNEAEPVVAKTLLQHTDRPGYVLADSIHDSQSLHECAASRELQLIAPRKLPGGNIGRRARHPSRLRAITMLEGCLTDFGPTMYARRTEIERRFSRLASSKVGLDHLPPFIRTPRRVHLWVQGKIILDWLQPDKDLRQ